MLRINRKKNSDKYIVLEVIAVLYNVILIGLNLQCINGINQATTSDICLIIMNRDGLTLLIGFFIEILILVDILLNSKANKVLAYLSIALFLIFYFLNSHYLKYFYA